MFEKADVEYPSVSICLEDPFVEKELKKVDQNFSFPLNKKSYLKFLKGESFDENLINEIEYDNVTINLNEYILYAIFQFRNESSYRVVTSEKLFNHKVTFNGFYIYGIFAKCFAPAISKLEYPNLKYFEIFYNSTRLLNDLSISILEKQRVHMNVHYPEQFLLEAHGGNGLLSSMLRHSIKQGTRLSITDMEIIKRRRNRNHDCTQNWKQFDSLVLDRHVKLIGCRPPYIQSVKSKGNENVTPPCKTEKKLKESKFDFYKARTDYYPKACHRVSRVNYFVKPYLVQLNWRVKILYPEEVKMITQSKEVDIHALIGNIGGYVGLFLGKSKHRK